MTLNGDVESQARDFVEALRAEREERLKRVESKKAEMKRVLAHFTAELNQEEQLLEGITEAIQRVTALFPTLKAADPEPSRREIDGSAATRSIVREIIARLPEQWFSAATMLAWLEANGWKTSSSDALGVVRATLGQMARRGELRKRASGGPRGAVEFRAASTREESTLLNP